MLLCLTLSSQAQTFYEVNYTDDGVEYLGLMIYYSDENCKMRLVTPESLEADMVFESQYVNMVEEKSDEDGVGIMAYYPLEKKFPIFLWYWEEDDASDISEKPFVTYDIKKTKSYIEAEYFHEIPLEEMDEEFISQFYGEDEPEYKMLLNGILLVKNQNLPHQDIEVTIAQCLGIEISITNITANRAYNKHNLANAITNLRPAKNDIVFFCFNGHGFRWDDQKDMYPNICMIGPNDDVYGNYVATTDIYNAIKNKGARLSVVITDCCNSKYGERGPRQKENTLFSRSNTRVSKKRMSELFLGTKGMILATAAKPGEYAWSFEGTGSAFTQSFISQLRKEVSATHTESPSWQRLLDNAIESARKKTTSCENTQHGMRYMSISKQ